MGYYIEDGYFFLYIYHRSLIQSDVTFLQTSGPEDHSEKRSMYCVMKCVETKRMLKTQICITRPQCVKLMYDWL
jgi:hypothetical protein